MNIHTTVGKVIFWVGFTLFILGFGFNKNFGIINDVPEIYGTLSLPAIILGVVLLLLSNFYKKSK